VILKKSLLFFVIASISLLFLEFSLRLFIEYRHRYFVVTHLDGTPYYSSNPKCWSILPDQRFRKTKETGAYRIFTFGGSTTMGTAYEGKVSFTKFLEWKLTNMLPSIPIETINLGYAGEYSKHVLGKVRAALKYDPDLFIVYSGHNEFIRFDSGTHSDSLWIEEILSKSYIYTKVFKRFLKRFGETTPSSQGETRQLEDQRICKPEQFMSVRQEYAENINEIVTIAKNAGVDVILSNLVGNYRSWEPNRSVHRSDLSQEALGQWRHHFSRGMEYARKSEFPFAIAEFERAKEIDGTFAELNYQLAKCYEGVQRYEDAKREYINAADNDGDPLIARSSFHKILEETCHKHEIPCVDVITEFENISENSLIGYNIMIDAHHPSMAGDLVIANAMANIMAGHGLPVFSQSWLFENDKPDIWYFNEASLTPEDELLHHHNLGLWFAKLSTTRYDPQDRLQRSKHHFQKAHRIDKNAYKTYIGFAILSLLESKPLEAKAHIQNACDRNLDGTIETLKDSWLAGWISPLLERNQVHVSRTCHIEVQ